jgi:hypothetical protein
MPSTPTGLLPSNQELLQSIAVSAASGVVLAGIKQQLASGALDPLGLFQNQAPSNNPNAITGPTVTASAFAALAPAVQAQLTAADVHIVAG